MNILFSPIGGTDPISKSFLDKEKKESVYTDGSMLHILRYYPIDKIYLYMSKEILDNENNDYRYTKSINNLCEKLSKNIEIAEIIKRPELTEVQEYDYFYEDFTKELRRIYDIESKNLKQPQNSQEQDEIKIYLNISSGTPAMKSALLVIQHLGEHDYIPVQVSTPVKKSNKEISKYPYEEYTDNNSDDNPDKYYRKNSDNKWIITKGMDEEQKVKFSDENPKGRCQEVKSDSLIDMKYIEIIKKFINIYEYDSALIASKEIKSNRKNKFINQIEIGKYRLLLQLDEVDKKLNEQNIENKKFYKIIGNKKEREIIEYFLTLIIKVEKGQYADFIRALSPLIQSLFEAIINSKLKISINNDFCSKDKNGKIVWDINKMFLSEKGRELYKILTESNNNRHQKLQFVTEGQLKKIIDRKISDKRVKNIAKKLRKIEYDIRHETAHTIISVTDEIIEKKTGHKSTEILDFLLETIKIAEIKISKEQINSYKRMNEEILRLISEN